MDGHGIDFKWRMGVGLSKKNYSVGRTRGMDIHTWDTCRDKYRLVNILYRDQHPKGINSHH